MAKMFMNLHLFGDGGAAGASAAPAAGAGEGGQAAVVTPGTLDDGTQVDARLAARMEEQARKRKARGQEPVKMAAPAAKAPEAQPAEGQPAAQEAEPSLEDQWAEAKKGKFKDLIGREIKAAIQDRFKNQKDANETLAKLDPALKALARQRGIEEGNLEALTEDILNDDSFFEEEADKAGMSVKAYRDMQAMKEENERLTRERQEEQESILLHRHFENLARQADELRKTYPDFDLMKEMENETFKRLTMPNSGLSVEAAYFAVHHKELEPQLMGYGIQRAQQQISQTLQANRARPMEGAMQTGQPANNVSLDPRTMTREERQHLKELARRGEKVVF